MPSTHSGAVDGPGLEKQLEGFQIMGIKYTEVRGAGARRRRCGGGSWPSGRSGRPRGAPAARPVESAKRQAAELNKYGAIVKKFGMKMLVHNHAGEFELLDDGKQTQYDVLLAETNPELVAMQLDVGWAAVAGQNILEMFAKHPGRFELWHVKDALGIKNADPKLSPTQRQRAAKLVPVGTGDVDYRAIFGGREAGRAEAFPDRAGQRRGVGRLARGGSGELPESLEDFIVDHLTARNRRGTKSCE